MRIALTFIVILATSTFVFADSPQTIKVWGEVVQPEASSPEDRARLNKKVFNFYPSGIIGGNPWTKRQEVPGTIVDIETKKVNESHNGAMCSYTVTELKENLFKVKVVFCGIVGSTARGELEITVYYE